MMDHTKLELVDKEANILNKLKQYYTDWQQTYTQIGLQINLVNNLISLQKGEETRFFAGEGSLFLINNRESRTIEASQKLIEIKAKNQKALIALQWSAGVLVERN